MFSPNGYCTRISSGSTPSHWAPTHRLLEPILEQRAEDVDLIADLAFVKLDHRPAAIGHLGGG